jgi:DDE superfamily endonuclease
MKNSSTCEQLGQSLRYPILCKNENNFANFDFFRPLRTCKRETQIAKSVIFGYFLQNGRSVLQTEPECAKLLSPGIFSEIIPLKSVEYGSYYTKTLAFVDNKDIDNNYDNTIISTTTTMTRNNSLDIIQLANAFYIRQTEAFHELMTSYENDRRQQVRHRNVRKKRRKLEQHWTDDTGQKHLITPRSSWWYNIFVRNPNINGVNSDSFHKKFRTQFRMPYNSFVELVQELERHPDFSRWHDGTKSAFNVAAAPISLLVLCALRYIGRGWTFDDCSNVTGISQEVVRVFFHAFIEYGSTVLYQKYVVAPTNSRECRQHSYEYERAGLPGAIGSTDATHIVVERVCERFRQSHIGYKMSHTARTYNITVNHRRQILATTDGHPARWNDKSLIKYDHFATGIKDGILLVDNVFELYEYDKSRGINNPDESNSSSTIVKRKYQGVWLLVDNGYNDWSVTVPPFTTTCCLDERRFSQWLESLRKDVECTFGILKGRWRVLKTGVRLGHEKLCDQIFMTCCALHNMLLMVDGLDRQWKEGVPSDWQGELGEVGADNGSIDEDDDDDNDDDDHHHNMIPAHIPDAIHRLNHPVARRSHEDALNDVEEEIESNAPIRYIRDNTANNTQTSTDPPRFVRSMTLKDFRSKLVTHFAIALRLNKVEWPVHCGRVPNLVANVE